MRLIDAGALSIDNVDLHAGLARMRDSVRDHASRKKLPPVAARASERPQISAFRPPPPTLRRWRSGPTPIPLALPPLPLHRMSMGANAITLLGANALTSPLAQQHA